MSLPNIPDITPDITLDRCEAINLLLASIAMEEIGLSHILNAEGEKIQAFIKLKKICLHDYYDFNHSLNKTLRNIVKSQILLQLKLEDVIEINNDHCCHHEACSKCHDKPCKNPCHKECES